MTERRNRESEDNSTVWEIAGAAALGFAAYKAVDYFMSGSESSPTKRVSTMDPQTKANNDNHANQCNPNNPRYNNHPSGYPGTATKGDLNNHSNQMNPNNSRHQGK